MDNENNTKPDSENGSPRAPMRGMAIWLLLLALFLTMYQVFATGPERYTKTAYSPDFLNLIEENRIRKCEIIMEVSGLTFIRGELTDVDEKTGRAKKFRVNVADTKAAQQLLSEKGIKFEVNPQNPYLWQILSVGPARSCSHGPDLFHVHPPDEDGRAGRHELSARAGPAC
jgi:hypothetical protein